MNITINAFEMGTPKEAALKPLEEASEVRAAWQAVAYAHTLVFVGRKDTNKERRFQHLADEIADCIQACANLADRYHIDLAAAMERCEQRNRERGRYD